MSQLRFASLPVISDVDPSNFSQGNPLYEATMKALADNARAGAVRPEMIYMGWFRHGDTVPQAISPVDGYLYSREETAYLIAAFGTQPAGVFSLGQKTRPSANPSRGLKIDWVSFDVDATGQVSSSVYYESANPNYPGGGQSGETHDGLVKVLAVCTRSGGGNYPSLVQTGYAEDHWINPSATFNQRNVAGNPLVAFWLHFGTGLPTGISDTAGNDWQAVSIDTDGDFSWGLWRAEAVASGPGNLVSVAAPGGYHTQLFLFEVGGVSAVPSIALADGSSPPVTGAVTVTGPALLLALIYNTSGAQLQTLPSGWSAAVNPLPNTFEGASIMRLATDAGTFSFSIPYALAASWRTFLLAFSRT